MDKISSVVVIRNGQLVVSIEKASAHRIVVAQRCPDALFERIQKTDAEVMQEPTDQPYSARDRAFRDPCGNTLRFTQNLSFSPSSPRYQEDAGCFNAWPMVVVVTRGGHRGYTRAVLGSSNTGADGGVFWQRLLERMDSDAIRLLTQQADARFAEITYVDSRGVNRALPLQVCGHFQRFLVGPGTIKAIKGRLGLEGLGTWAASDEDPMLAFDDWVDESAQLLRWIAAGGVRLEIWRHADRNAAQDRNTATKGRSSTGFIGGYESSPRAFRWSMRRHRRFVPFITVGSAWWRWWPADEVIVFGSRSGRCHTGPDSRRPWTGFDEISSSGLDNREVVQSADAEDGVEIPIDGVLDLHHFPPSQVGKVVKAYLDACQERGITELRLIHGKGKGHLRRSVHSILKKDPRVLEFRLGGTGAGQWGATVVTMLESPEAPVLPRVGMIVIGAGRIGTALKQLEPEKVLLLGRGGVVIARERGETMTPVVESAKPSGDKPGKFWPAGPIVVATRNNDLDAVLQRVPNDRHRDLVFIQNGMLRSWLEDHHLEQATRGILRFAVQKKGESPVPGDSSLFWGPHAKTLADWLNAHSIQAEAVEASTFAHLEIEKLVWNSAFGLLCDVHQMTVGQIVKERRDDFDRLSAELLHCCSQALEVPVEITKMQASMRQYSLSIADYRAAVKEWPWRNGWIVQAAEKMGRPLPIHQALCQRLKTSPV